MNTEFLELIKDLKEQVKYLAELGVEKLEADLPEFSAKSQIENPILRSVASPNISRERLEKFVPTDEILKKITSDAKDRSVNSDDSKTVRRSGLLNSSRISDMPSLPKRNFGDRTFSSEKNTTKTEQTREGKKDMAEKDLSNSLFGDITETLPETNETIEDVRVEIGDCTRCPLHEGRTQIVQSTGNINADLMFVGEAPGADEDAQGVPFVGRSGKLLDKIIEAIGMKREDVFIGNINRCRPPGNRTPTLEEAETCKPFLLKEVAIVRPKIIVVMGNTAMKNLLNTKEGITKMRGSFVDYYGVKVMPTFHPAYLLRDPRKKREVWEDMKMVKAELEKAK